MSSAIPTDKGQITTPSEGRRTVSIEETNAAIAKCGSAP